jgi:OmpA-OmpF porin, OOP family
MIMNILRCCMISFLLSTAAFMAQAESVITLPSGNFQIIDISSTYGGNWHPRGLIDENPAKGWASKENAPFPHHVLYELKGVHSISSVMFDTTQTEEQSHSGISAKDIELQVSLSKGGPFITAGTFVLPQASQGTFKLPTAFQARFVRIIVNSNYGRTDYTEIMEIGLSGEALDQRTDLLDLSAGTVLLDYSSEYKGWFALSLLDGTLRTGWASNRGVKPPHHFDFELSRHYLIDTLVLDTRGAEESTHPGVSAHKVEIYASTLDSGDDYQLIDIFEATPASFNYWKLATPVEARRIRLVVISNGGRDDYTEIMELEAYGEPVGEPGKAQSISAVYDTNFGLMRIEQNNHEIEGCYDHDGGRLSGSTDGRTLKFEWREKIDGEGIAIMVLSSDSERLNGLWYSEGVLKGKWYGSRITDGSIPNCAKDMANTSSLESRLEDTGRAIVYGIYFDHNSDKLKPSSSTTLQQILDYLEKDPSRNITIEGHTDSIGDKAYNTELSTRRANSVAQWLIQKKITAERLKPVGMGERNPVSDNSTAQGRTMNRRVEIANQ